MCSLHLTWSSHIPPTLSPAITIPTNSISTRWFQYPSDTSKSKMPNKILFPNFLNGSKNQTKFCGKNHTKFLEHQWKSPSIPFRNILLDHIQSFPTESASNADSSASLAAWAFNNSGVRRYICCAVDWHRVTWRLATWRLATTLKAVDWCFASPKKGAEDGNY